MPDDTTEPVAEHSARLQPSINLHAPVTAFMFSCSGTQCTIYPEGMKARVSPVGYISDTARNRTHNLFRPKREPIPLGHSDGQISLVYPLPSDTASTFCMQARECHLGCSCYDPDNRGPFERHTAVSYIITYMVTNA